MKKAAMVLVALLFPLSYLYAADFEDRIIQARNLLQQGTNQRDKAMMQESLTQFQNLLPMKKQAWLVHFYIAFADFRMGIYYNMEHDKKKAGKYFDSAIDQLKKSQELNDSFPESFALLSACYGNKIGLAPWKGMLLGPRSGKAMNKAVSLGPQNPRVWLMKGVGSSFSPKAFGGGKEKAVEELKKALKLYEQQKPLDPIYPRWGHDEACAQLGIVLKELGRPEEAKAAFMKGLTINPENGRIKFKLLPDLAKGLGKPSP